ncbi:hypothetical protein SAMN05443549_105143 [Flavobacterium fluvii]|uniref:Uncharacterized protein n=1 Tax=Flavobacterium fluvii TaxID=468056 RepID=A0A1M5LCN9_9FLAO|nr:DUF5958 family protein [Flavobacterium fluvii]SHG62173.1 hypothetical protein SAMN05443549_105143 [Flavobacterium fluvii]
MDKIELIINEIAQNKIEFNEGCQTVLNDKGFNFETIFSCLRNYIFNSIPEKTNYNTQTYQNAIKTIPLKSTFTPIVILKSFDTKIAFNKLEKIIENEREKTIIALLWILKQTDTERRNTECKNGCGHDWHNIE